MFVEYLNMIKKAFAWSGWEIVGNAFTAIGIISAVLAVVRFIHECRRKRWESNVSIQDYPMNYDVELEEKNAIYSELWTEQATEYMVIIVFKPVGCVIPKLKVIAINTEGKESGTIQVFQNLTPDDAVCFRLERAECIPCAKLRWYSNFGEYSEHYFSDNGRNGINAVGGTEYHATMFSVIRRVLGLQ